MNDIHDICKQLENLLTEFTWDEHDRQTLLSAQAHINQQQYDYAMSQLTHLNDNISNRQQRLAAIIDNLNDKPAADDDDNFKHQLADFFDQLYHKQYTPSEVAARIVQANTWELSQDDNNKQ